MEANLMESVNIIMQAISTMGFPIVMCLILLKYLQEFQNSNNSRNLELHDAIVANSQLLKVLLSKLDTIEKYFFEHEDPAS